MDSLSEMNFANSSCLRPIFSLFALRIAGKSSLIVWIISLSGAFFASLLFDFCKRISGFLITFPKDAHFCHTFSSTPSTNAVIRVPSLPHISHAAIFYSLLLKINIS